MAWSTRFDDPVPLPRGRALLTLRDAGRYIQQLPPVEQRRKPWQVATRILIAAAEGRDSPIHARIAVARALRPQAAPPSGK